MKKIIAILLLTIFSVAAAFAQEFTLSGFSRSGIYWQRAQNQGLDAREDVTMHSKDDSGGGQGRVRFDLEYSHGIMGVKARIQWDNWRAGSPDWTYAFMYGDFFDDQLTIAVGKLGESPWRTGGPEMWKELEVSTQGGGMRTEYKPNFLPGLNVGFVLNYFNNAGDQGWDTNIKPYTLAEILKESVVGIAYEHDLFLVRFAYRFDSEADAIAGNTGGKGEDEYVFRLEENILANYLPDFKVWAIGYGVGWNAPPENNTFLLQNWLFTEYDPEHFTAQIRFGYDYSNNRSILHFRPSFYWKFFGNLLNVGVSYWYGQDFGEYKIHEGSPYTYMEFEPKIQVNFGNSSYVAFVYNFRTEYINQYEVLGIPVDQPIRQTQWMNLRFCLTL